MDVWFDEFELLAGSSLRKEIAGAIARASCAVVILSKPFFKKAWTERELAGIVSMETSKKLLVIPIWHGVSLKEVTAYDPSLADNIGLSASALPVELIALRIEEAIRLRKKR